MAEVAAIASIAGIAGFGIQLTQTLYTFGSTVSSAREDANYIARHVDLYSNVLDILTERIDDEEPILSDAAFDLIDELKYQSNDLFKKIEQSLPSTKEGRDDISFMQKVKWSFTKSKVALLVGELDYLRSTVHLLVTIIFTGRRIRSHNKRKVKSGGKGLPDLNDDLRKQGAKAQNALLAHCEALENLSDLEKVEHADFSGQVAQQTPICPPASRTEVISTNTTALSELQQSIVAYTDPSERQRLVLYHSVRTLQQLLQQWTIVDISSPEDIAERGQFDSDSQHTKTDTDAASKTESLKPSTTRDSGYDSVTSSGSNSGRRESPIPNEKQSAAENPIHDEKSSKDVGSKSSSTPIPERPRPLMALPLPQGWLAHFDPNTGANYYSNIRTGKTQWEFPTTEISDDIPPPRLSTKYSVVGGERIAVHSENLHEAPFGLKSTVSKSEKPSFEGSNRQPFPTEKSPASKGTENLYDNFFKSAAFGDIINDTSRNKARPSDACRACDGRGADKTKPCFECNGTGSRPGYYTDLESCSQCSGSGRLMRRKYLCKVCNGTKKEPSPLSNPLSNAVHELLQAQKNEFHGGNPRRSNVYERGSKQPPSKESGLKFSASEDEDGRERIQCASQ